MIPINDVLFKTKLKESCDMLNKNRSADDSVSGYCKRIGLLTRLVLEGPGVFEFWQNTKCIKKN